MVIKISEEEKAETDGSLEGLRLKVAEADLEMLKNLRNRLLNVIDEIDRGFKRVMFMYTIAFYSGVSIVLFSIVSTVVNGSNTFTLIFGGVGALDVIAFFVFRPAEDLQKSRANLAQLVAAFMTWNNDMRSWADVKQKKIWIDGEQEKDKNNANDINALHEISKRMIIDTVTIMMAIDVFVEGKQSGDEVKRFQDIMKTFQDGLQTK